ncbi:hypothetical protein [Guillardia theta]|uniref:Brix domain-containing protein n=1 Tax=Guillardia theta TaxID=55529 RepID=Q9AVW6_GUITH|nr:hypothetical protein GTHECHR2185 [Guillardia theta]CAC27105.1 hypothetical protein [Guillardia theta]|mmetsp:Transcript_26273/g.86338  ORF Transcript_26273/g.86338 Transcript_26273/m.86338 type:complete len:187 (+) Transcript_26273:162-722(+)
MKFYSIITTSKKPSKTLLKILHLLKKYLITPRYYKRNKFKFRHLMIYLKRKNINNMIYLFENNNRYFVSIVNFQENIHIKFGINNLLITSRISSIIYKDYPEIIYLNFKAQHEIYIQKVLTQILYQVSPLTNRELLCIYSNKGIIYFRSFRYIFSKNLRDVKIQEIGPRLNFKILNILSFKINKSI